MGEVEHAELVLAVIRWFLARENEWRIRILPEVRVQVAAERFRIPDLCICDQGNSDKRIVTTTPLLVIEVSLPRIASAATMSAWPTIDAWGFGESGCLTPRPTKRGTAPPATG